MRQAHFTRARHAHAAADQAGVGNAVVRRAEGALVQQPDAAAQRARDTVDLGGLNRLLEGERRENAREALGDNPYTLEEVEQDSYKGRQVWRITLGFPKRRPTAPELMRLIGAGLPLEYKTFLVDATTGEPIAMKLAS